MTIFSEKKGKHTKSIKKVMKTTQARWFKVPFSSPCWRSLNHPKKVTLNHQEMIDTNKLLENNSATQRKPRLEAAMAAWCKRAMWRSRLKSLGDLTAAVGSFEKAYHLKIMGGVTQFGKIYSWISITLVVCVYVAVEKAKLHGFSHNSGGKIFHKIWQPSPKKKRR